MEREAQEHESPNVILARETARIRAGDVVWGGVAGATCVQGVAEQCTRAVMSKAFSQRSRVILVSDLDWTMVDHDDKEHKALTAFKELWAKRFAEDCLLIFSTGRSHALFTKLQEEVPLGKPDVLICSVGTEIFMDVDSPDPVARESWTRKLDQGWDRKTILEAASKHKQLQLQGKSEQRPHKVSYTVTVKGKEAAEVITALDRDLAAAGLSAKVIYSGGEDLDILPQQASKGKGLEFLLSQIQETVGAPTQGMLVCGDSGNDVELFQVPDVKGCMVANAHPELKEWCDAHPSPSLFQASRRCAGGIVEALHHFGWVQ